MASPASLHDPMVIDIEIEEISKIFDIEVEELSQVFDFELETAIVIGQNTYDIYDGETVVTPKAHSETVLETAEKVVMDDITVLQIPYYETSNLSGGYTVYIAGEV